MMLVESQRSKFPEEATRTGATAVTKSWDESRSVEAAADGRTD